MDSSNEIGESSPPLSQSARIDQICERFEEAVRSAMQDAEPWPNVDDFLGDLSGPLRTQAREQLTAIETYCRRSPDYRAANEPTLAAPSGERQSGPDSDPAGLASTRGRPVAAEDGPMEIPELIGGRYRVETRLGEGAFGRVYRCKDEVLKRTVAVKVPHRKLVGNPQIYLAEAQILADLEHPAIVRVYDFGLTEDGLCYVVSMFIDGSDLKKKMHAAPLSHRESAELAATVADALHYAHVRRIVHRDLKPANILIDSHLRPYIADFGLALKDEEYGQHGHEAGTPAYMSPEQARSEGHLVDGRSDLFSLGVVLYELLTAAKPFRGSSITEILERIKALEPRPPRQVDDTIPKDLERICLKALAKRASERYNTARDMADELRAFLADSDAGSTSHGGSQTAEAAVRASPLGDSQSVSHVGTESRGIVKIVPKGLRSFDKEDAEFFPNLLPGPHDRHGLPESIRFWKTRIEETDPENSFRVGIIYGPSGCGKSSLVKAGLLPRLDPSVERVYVEAAGDGTEGRLLRVIRRRLPQLGEQADLVKTLAAVRRGQGLAAGNKLLLVIDQFEQWLHAHGSEEETELVLALRQCDGLRIQCLLMVRDDFWLAVSRFMQALEVRVVEGENSRLVDLFDERHARKVLAALGVAFGALPETGRTSEQERFIEQAVAGLAQDGKVVSVRLALFAEMFKGKPWTPGALREIGGAEGVGVAFLEETFSSPSSPPHHRLYQKTAQAVLAALLPDMGTDIKGHVRSRDELLAVSGCDGSQRQFDEVMAMLDHELRLVSPTDTESVDAQSESSLHSGARNKGYQLTHDYLVPSLRTWLTRKQKATRQGRAELRLADFTSLWSARPENRRLPSVFEYLQIRFHTSRKTWNEAQRKMMRAAGRLHGLRWTAVVVCVALVVSGAYEFVGRLRANGLRDELYRAEFDKVPVILEELANYKRWARPRLQQDLDDATGNLRSDSADEKGRDNRTRLRASLALLPGDPSQAEFLYDRLIAAPSDEVDTIRRELLKHEQQLPPNVLEGQLAAEMGDDPSDPKNKLIGERKAHAAIALLLINRTDKVWPLFSNAKDETVRSFLIHWGRPLHVDPQIIADRCAVETDVGALGALLLMLGEYPDFGLQDGQRQRLAARLQTVFETEPVAGLHAAAQWLLSKWRYDDALKSAVDRLAKTERERARDRGDSRRRWYVNQQGQTFVIVDSKGPFLMGSAASEHGPDTFIEDRHSRRIGRTYAIAASPVTIAQFAKFQAVRPDVARMRLTAELAPSGDCPRTGMTWYEAAEYCNWLSEKDEIARDQWCYQPNAAGKYGNGMRVKDNCLSLVGYRLPTEAEWEFACRSGTTTRFFCGEDDAVLADYAWYGANIARICPVAQFKPNDFGLFDMHGNVWQWCDCPSLDYPSGLAIADDERATTEPITNSMRAALRGGAYDNLSRRVRAAFRARQSPDSRQPSFGFRPVRTIKTKSEQSANGRKVPRLPTDLESQECGFRGIV